ncbi:TIGR03808 family TAT-translocated repetitive protein [Nitratireductor mangrovi]|uniref:TIGR03808 family TAT-translocated repetitive protein n=1 Tax=Nitratireductor mangrovi TaxID=2599600 RepID=A0A5B8KZP7_9HYPH|nr:TIGR03808 family TAT-translocated repetitive protein [Nitratireductor mangrovi]QDZ01071.1 TIGR03808 family TAT-translocated repetitive protein [Nitratireductor mangrovi]
MLNRRAFLAGATAMGAAVTLPARAANLSGIETASIRGSLDAAELGMQPGTYDDQSKAFQDILQKAADRDAPVYLPPGDYVVSNIILPRQLRMTGVPGASRIIYGGNGHLFLAEAADHLELTGITLDGANRWMSDHVPALVAVRGARRLVVDNCTIIGSGKHALSLEAVAGRIERSEISGAADAAIYSVQASGLSIIGNTISDCGNNGILVHRWQPGEDGTIVSGNRVSRIAARNGGTGPFGNGINVFRAGNVMVTDNAISDCAFSAIRSNGGSNIQITGNNCLRSGETAVYSEFAYEGALIAGNIVDGAANGISMVNYNEGGRLAVCSGNLVRNLSTSGPYEADPPGFGVGITAEADTAVTGNVVENAPLFGLHLGWGPFLRNVTATGNIIRRAGTGIAVSVVEGAGAAVIADNVISETPNGAIRGHRWVDRVTHDLITGDTSGFRHLTVERNRAG